jgi:predicted GIY-YIG superfamily endonuclease
MTQKLLFPDPRPLVETLGPEFFRQAPEGPGVYLMRDALDTVLYVGKAKNLRRRLTSYRVANPDRMRRRHLRLLRAVARIELEECPNELSALSRESELLLQLRPRFNRAGTWPGPARFLAFKVTRTTIDLAVATTTSDQAWQYHGPLGVGAIHLRAALARLLWCALGPEHALMEMPAGWLNGRFADTVTIIRNENPNSGEDDFAIHLASVLSGQADGFANWVCERTVRFSHPFEQAIIGADLETVCKGTTRVKAETRAAEIQRSS